MRQLTHSVSVIICTYSEQRWAYLAKAIASIQAQNYQPLEIIVVVDHNPGMLQKIIDTWPFVAAIPNHEAKGASGAKNTGIRAAKGSILAFLDDDAKATPDWLENLLQGYTDWKVMGVGGKIEALWENTVPKWFPAEFNWVVGCTYCGMPEQASYIRNLIGANMSFRREVFEKIGLFRDGIGPQGVQPTGCEETELCIRVQQYWSDQVLFYEPTAKVLHHVPSRRSTWSYFYRRCFYEGRSKAAIVRYVGVRDGLASERAYTFKTLPLGIVKGLAQVFTRGDAGGLGRAVAIITGLASTLFGYLTGKYLQSVPPTKPQTLREQSR